MSNLEELIERLCPDGVKAVELGQVAHYAKNRIDADAVTENTYVGVENLLQNKAGKTVAVSVPTKGTVIAFNPNDILIGNIRPYLKKIWLSDCAGGTNGDVLVIQIDERERLLPKYLFYVLSSDRFFLYDMQNSKGAKMPRGNKAAILKYRIPVPPLPVQGEIVRILDNFTELTAELTAELAARQKQYEYYRDLLLTFKSNENTILNELELSGAIRWMKLGDICDVRDGTHDSPKQTLNGKYLITSKNIKNGTIDYAGSYFISNEDFDKINLRSKVEINDILFTMIGTIGEIGLVKNEPDYAIKNVGLIKTNNELLSRFLKHYLKSKQVKKYIDNNKSQGSQSFLALGKLRNIPIPILKTQRIETIVDILDRFDILCNDITSGLPAEIEMRQKQYEYYRDKLLTFKELKKEA